MTEDQRIEAAIEQRLKDEGLATEAPKAQAATNPQPKENQNVPASTSEVAPANPYTVLAQAVDANAKAKEENKSNIPGVETAKSIYNQIPDRDKPLAFGVVGYGVGKVLRNNLPQQLVYGTPEYRAAEIAQANAAKAHTDYRAQSDVIKGQHNAAQQQHAANLAELEKAHQQHAFAQTLNVDEELARRSNLALPSSKDVTLQPKGGVGTANYAEKFGASPAEAHQVPSMSAMQQENIPAQQKAWEKINNISPNFSPIKESPLILGPEGQQATRERLNRESDVAAEAARRQDIERKRVADAIARHRAAVQLALENAQNAAKTSRGDLTNAEKSLTTHAANVPPAPAPTPEGIPRALRALGKIAPRFVPGVGAALAPIEAEAALREYRSGNYGRMATHGLGTLGALAQGTGIPLLMGAGDIMQIPSAGLAMYDMFNNENTGQKVGQ